MEREKEGVVGTVLYLAMMLLLPCVVCREGKERKRCWLGRSKGVLEREGKGGLGGSIYARIQTHTHTERERAYWNKFRFEKIRVVIKD